MTEAGINEGMWVLAVDAYHWQKLYGEPNDGRLVIVTRSRDGDPERELTVKRLRIYRDRIELQPESKNPRHKPVIFQRGSGDEHTEAQILAVVLQAVRVY